MPKRDAFHDQFISALKSDGWVITGDPFYLKVDNIRMYIDVAAERKTDGQMEELAVEVKNFISISNMNEFEKAIGQYLVYKTAFELLESKRDFPCRPYLFLPRGVE
ncbi:element excision factor XisH family protein [Lewinella sp. 4G2]|uniref:element excision factor XisH family protein n=1 Tax=Lewinella sp. 4G2 TaxID=1803372 RepID=UPI0007B4BD29|nr:element excision factor XisH family protein [Lewinella sp. 4G2]OAV42667.1 hypothetical protein A3850_015605 [Lewinella sp. 4G2]